MMPGVTSPSDKNSKPLLDAMAQAQLIAFGPLLFHAARALRDRGMLKALHRANPDGLSTEEVAQATQTSRYGTIVLLEAGLAAGLVEKDGDRYRVTTTGYLIERDPMTRANMNFVGDVCYGAAAHLSEAIDTGKPAGLRELGNFETVYEGLRHLEEPARTSWFEFDHFYSDDSFPKILHEVFGSKPHKVLDVGGNTGKFALAALRHDQEVEVTVADLPGQIASCREHVKEEGYAARAHFHEFSILEAGAVLPPGHDVIWMSQFLCCFGEDEVVHNLKVARRAMDASTRLLIMDNFWDQQKNPVAALCLQATSLYFTVVANGTSRMYDSVTMLACIERADLRVTRVEHGIGWGHSLIECALPS